MTTKRKSHSGRGRPTKYSPRIAALFLEKMGSGFSITATCGFAGISRDTCYRWAHENADFSDALARARAKCCLFWERHLLRIARGGRGSDRAALLALRQLGGPEWRDDQQATDAGSAPLPPGQFLVSVDQMQKLTIEQIDQLIEILGVLNPEAGAQGPLLEHLPAEMDAADSPMSLGRRNAAPNP